MKRALRRSSTLAGVVIIIGVGAAITFGLLLADDGDDLADLAGSNDKVIQPLQLHGHWMGISVAQPDSPAAQAFQVPPSTPGVVVVDVTQAGLGTGPSGLSAGDVITSVNEVAVADMGDFYDVTQGTPVNQAIALEILRAGQALSLVIPAANMAPGQPLMPLPGAPAGAIPAAQQQPGVPLYMCPQHQMGWQRQAVHPNYRCPLCTRPLVLQVK